MVRPFLTFCLASVLLASCAPSRPTDASSPQSSKTETAQTVREAVERCPQWSRTTDLLREIGRPDKTDFDDQEEQWTYRMADGYVVYTVRSGVVFHVTTF